jgi:hypothetical protein
VCERNRRNDANGIGRYPHVKNQEHDRSSANFGNVSVPCQRRVLRAFLGKLRRGRVLGPLKPLTRADTADVFRLRSEVLAPVSMLSKCFGKSPGPIGARHRTSAKTNNLTWCVELCHQEEIVSGFGADSAASAATCHTEGDHPEIP